MDILSLTTSLLAIFSSAFTVVTLSRDWQRRTTFAKDVLDVHSREIGVLRSVLKECEDTVENVADIMDVPPSIYEAFQNCEQREATLNKTLESVTTGNTGNAFFLRTVRLPLLQKDLKRQYGMFKEDVLLLRALCTELVFYTTVPLKKSLLNKCKAEITTTIGGYEVGVHSCTLESL